jgi:hypothetical protein
VRQKTHYVRKQIFQSLQRLKALTHRDYAIDFLSQTYVKKECKNSFVYRWNVNVVLDIDGMQI